MKSNVKVYTKKIVNNNNTIENHWKHEFCTWVRRFTYMSLKFIHNNILNQHPRYYSNNYCSDNSSRTVIIGQIGEGTVIIMEFLISILNDQCIYLIKHNIQEIYQRE